MESANAEGKPILISNHFAFAVGDIGIKRNGSDFFVAVIAKNTNQSANWAFALDVDVDAGLLEFSFKSFTIFSFAASDGAVLFV